MYISLSKLFGRYSRKTKKKKEEETMEITLLHLE